MSAILFVSPLVGQSFGQVCVYLGPSFGLYVSVCQASAGEKSVLFYVVVLYGFRGLEGTLQYTLEYVTFPLRHFPVIKNLEK